MNDVSDSIHQAEHAVLRTGGNAAPAANTELGLDQRVLGRSLVAAARSGITDFSDHALFFAPVDCSLPGSKEGKQPGEEKAHGDRKRDIHVFPLPQKVE
jgi:hypothetical protein